MDVKNQLIHEKTKLLKQIAESAQQGKSQEVLSAGERLNKIESLVERYENLVRDIANLDTNGRKTQPFQNTRVGSRLAKGRTPHTMDVASGRGMGRIIRMDFLKKTSEEGIHLEHIRGSIYETKSGHKVGIAVATERNPDRWFLGLPLEGFDHAVLLCKRGAGDTVEICLPKNFFEKYGDKMSQSGGQMKFNVARRGSGYSILVPGTDGISDSKFLGDYSLLK
jgi:hypothetical protein